MLRKYGQPTCTIYRRDGHYRAMFGLGQTWPNYLRVGEGWLLQGAPSYQNFAILTSGTVHRQWERVNTWTRVSHFGVGAANEVAVPRIKSGFPDGACGKPWFPALPANEDAGRLTRAFLSPDSLGWVTPFAEAILARAEGEWTERCQPGLYWAAPA
jgi:hypothetical protein